MGRCCCSMDTKDVVERERQERKEEKGSAEEQRIGVSSARGGGDSGDRQPTPIEPI